MIKNERIITKAAPEASAEGAKEGLSNTPPSREETKVAQTPLRFNCCIDYLKFTFVGEFNPHKPSYKELEELLTAYRIDPTLFQERRGCSGYERGYDFGVGLAVFAGGAFTASEGRETFNIEMKGEACRAFESDCAYEAQTKGIDKDQFTFECWRNLMLTVFKFGGKCTRIDLPTDDFCGAIPFDELREKIEGRVFASRLRSFSIEDNPAEKDEAGNYSVRKSHGKGWTATIGSRNNAQLCIYNKKAEREAKGDLDAERWDSWIRYEVRYYHGSADFAARMLATVYELKGPADVAKFIVGCLAGIIDIKEKKTKQTRKQRTWDKWAEFIKGASAVTVLSAAKTESSVGSNAMWLGQDATKSIARTCGAHPEWTLDLYLALLKDGLSKLDNKDLFKVNEHRKARGLPPYEDLKALRDEVGCYVAFGETPEGLANLLSHEVAKLGSAKVVPQGGGS